MYKPTPHFLIAMLLTLVASGCLFASPALATIVNTTWTNPTTRTNGDALPASELRGTRVERGTCDGALFGTVQSEGIASAGATALTFDLGPGLYCFRAFARAVDRANPTAFFESFASNVASRALADAPPNPPTGLTTTVTVAFDMTGKHKLGREVGIVALGTPCNGNIALVKGDKVYYGLKASDVDFIRKPRSTVILAECGAA